VKPKPKSTTKTRDREFLLPMEKEGDSVCCLDEDDSPFESAETIEIEVEEISTAASENLHFRILALEEENRKLKDENKRLKDENEFLTRKLSSSEVQGWFCIENFRSDSQLFKFYTGLPDYETFKAVFDSFGPAVKNLVYHHSKTNSCNILSHEYVKRGPKRSLSPENEFFLVLVRMRLGLLEADIACRASLSTAHVSRICITWIDFLHSYFRQLPIWPTRSYIDETMPKSFKATYPSTRVVIDCTELYIEMASSVRSQSATYSNYKHYNTAKGLLGITPAESISFVSDLYAGRTSDKQATVDCKILQLLEAGDSVMADKGFDIDHDLPAGTTLNIPPFLKGKDYLEPQEEIDTRCIASVRIHVEGAISRIKTFRILKTVFPISMAAELNKIWVVCCFLTNFLPPLIKDAYS